MSAVERLFVFLCVLLQAELYATLIPEDLRGLADRPIANEPLKARSIFKTIAHDLTFIDPPPLPRPQGSAGYHSL